MRSPYILTWHPATWHSRKAAQQPLYKDSHALADAVAKLSRLPPLVVSWEIDALKAQIAAAQRGERFVLQGGDCAETFDRCESDPIARQLKVLLQMSLVLLQGLKKPVVRIGRMAGQYAKPRSADLETHDGVTLPSYRGDNINRPGFTAQEREPDPLLLLRGYERAALTLNFVRSLASGGFADLHSPRNWDLEIVSRSPLNERYRKTVSSVSEALSFFSAMNDERAFEARRVDFYTSHEGLHLLSEQAQTRYIPRQEHWYDLSTHMPWIGMRTATLDGAHVEFFRGIANPIGIKLGAPMTAEWLQGLLATLNPNHEPGRITLICRFGAKQVEKCLPPLVEAVRATGSPVLWMCDPMHGNTETTVSGHKTRRFEHIMAELESSFRLHKDMGTVLGGIHLELTGDDVTECTGGACGLTDRDLSRAYQSAVDPRLNAEQALELALRVADRFDVRQ